METLGTFLHHVTELYGPRPALLCQPRYRTETWSYTRVWEESTAIAAWLGERGMAKGDRVVLWAPNSPRWVAVFFGCARIGAIVVPLDVRSSPDFVSRVVAQTEPSLAIIAGALADAWPHATDTMRMEDLEDIPRPGNGPVEDTACPDDIAEVIFTSGTTGDPKGVMLTHANILANVAAVDRVIPTYAHYRLLSLLPLSHMFEQTVGLLLPLRRGGSIYYSLSRQSTALFRALRDQRITTMLAVPQVLHLFMAAIEREVERQGKGRAWRRMRQVAAYLPMPARRLLFAGVHRRLGGNLRFLASGGAPLEPDLIRQWELLGVPVVQGYGATEAGPVIAGTGLGDRNPRSVGKAVPGVAIKLAPDGEVLARGPSITRGYWRNEAATAAAFVDGWYRTGDLGEIDARGYLYLHGRKKDLIVLSNGQNVYPEDVEGALRNVEGVADAAVVGLPGPGGTRVHAVLLCDGPTRDPEALIRRANAGLASHQQIQGVTLWPQPDFPRTHTLKIKKQELLRMLLATGGAAELPAGRPAEGLSRSTSLRHVIAAAAGVPPERVTPQATLGDDLGLDSLGRVELLAAVEEQRGIYLDESLVNPRTTVAELHALMEAQESAGRPRFPRWPLSPPAGALRRACQGAAFRLLRRIAPATVSGREALETLAPPVLFVADHTSHLDSPTLLQALPPRWRRRVAVAAAADYFFSHTLLGAGVALLLNAFPFSRTTAIRPTLEHCAWLLDHGWSVLLYPEGTRSPTGMLGPFKPGIGLLAVELGVPVVPVRTRGLYAVLPKGRRLPRRGGVTVQFGRPLCFSPGTSYAAATAAVEAAVRTLEA